jgi:hypothetical protein
MGAILSFVPRTAASKASKTLPQEAAAIIIFPGVRYEKHDAGAVTAAKGRTAGEREMPPAKH